MKPRQWIIPLFVSLTLGAGCTAGDEPLELDYPPGQGAIHLSLDSADPILGTLHGLIRITQGATTVTERELDPGGRARTYDIIYLEEGVYDVEVRLEDDEGNLALFGERSGVHVQPGLLTSITIVLQSAGGVQVEVEMPGIPTRFSAVVEGHLPDCIAIDGPYYGPLRGTQRVDPETGETRYYAWVWDVRGEYMLLQGSSPEGLLDSECLPTSLDMNTEQHNPVSVTVGGDYFYLVDYCWGNIIVHRSLDGVDWELVSTISPTFQISIDGSRDFICCGCSIIIDNQFNIFCRITDFNSIDPDTASSEQIVAHIFSPDGVEWSPFVYREDYSDILQSDIGHLDIWSDIEAVTFVNNRYVSWFALRGSSLVSVSTDREVWSELIELETSGSSVVTGHLTPYFTESGIELFRTAGSNSNVVIYREE